MQPVFGVLTLGNIADHFRVSPQRAILIIHWRYDGFAPELRPVLAQSPSAILVTPGLHGLLQCFLGIVLAAARFRVETGEMTAQDFIGFVTLDPGCPGIPARNLSLGSEHVNRIVL